MRLAAKWSIGEPEMPMDDKRCLAALLYAYCVSADTDFPEERVGKFKDAAAAFVRRSCDEERRRRMIPTFGPIAAKWHELYSWSRRGSQ
jgi:hypothetical protein